MKFQSKQNHETAKLSKWAETVEHIAQVEENVKALQKVEDSTKQIRRDWRKSIDKDLVQDIEAFK